MGLAEGYQRRRKRDLEAMGAMVATAVSKPNDIPKVIRGSSSRLHGGRQRARSPWWTREGGG